MVRHFLLNDDGKTYREIDLFGESMATSFERNMEFAKQLADGERRNVGDDEIQGYRISTKFIGVDTSSAFFNAPPRPFECMAFGPELTEVLGRFETWEQAANFHSGVMEVLRALDDGGKAISATAIDVARMSASRRVKNPSKGD